MGLAGSLTEFGRLEVMDSVPRTASTRVVATACGKLGAVNDSVELHRPTIWASSLLCRGHVPADGGETR